MQFKELRRFLWERHLLRHRCHGTRWTKTFGIRLKQDETWYIVKMFETKTLPEPRYQDTLHSYSVTLSVYYTWPALTDMADCHWFMLIADKQTIHSDWRNVRQELMLQVDRKYKQSREIELQRDMEVQDTIRTRYESWDWAKTKTLKSCPEMSRDKTRVLRLPSLAACQSEASQAYLFRPSFRTVRIACVNY